MRARFRIPTEFELGRKVGVSCFLLLVAHLPVEISSLKFKKPAMNTFYQAPGLACVCRTMDKTALKGPLPLENLREQRWRISPKCGAGWLRAEVGYRDKVNLGRGEGKAGIAPRDRVGRGKIGEDCNMMKPGSRETEGAKNLQGCFGTAASTPTD